MEISWNSKTKNDFDRLIENLPQFHRSIAERLVKEKAEEIALARRAKEVESQDMVKAFFQEVPPAFKDMMKRLFSHLKVDYAQYSDESS